MKYDNRILHGSALDQLKTLDSDSVDCCITSPPYWALRDYKTEGQLGLEPTFQEYIKKLVDIFSEVRRVLKKSGACWINLGDTYAGTGSKGNYETRDPKYRNGRNGQDIALNNKVPGIADKCLCCIPERFAIAMVDQGWILRNKIIWYKPNCMPSSAKDRFTVNWEYLFFFSKSQRYYFETQYEPMGWTEDKPMPKIGGNKAPGYENPTYSGNQPEVSPLGRIKRCVWKIPTAAFSEAHFATFPSALVKTPLLATCPEYVCRKCGKARVTLYGPAKYKTGEGFNGKHKDSKDNILRNIKALREIQGTHEPTFDRDVLGLSDCGCNAGFDGGIVLDCFFGSGTVGLVALKNARNFIGIELSQAYIEMALKRLSPYLAQTRLV